MIHSIVYRTYPPNKAIRYALTLFLIGLFLAFISFKYIDYDNTQNIVSILGVFLIFASFYIFPYINPDNIEKFLYKFLKYVILLVVCISYTLFWMKLVSNNRNCITTLIFTIFDIVLLVPTINFTIKPIFEIILTISSKIRKASINSGELKIWTNTKIALANIGIVVSFFISLLTLVTSVKNLF